MESRRVAGGLIEQFDGVGEREVGICGAQRREAGHGGVAFDVDAVLNKHGGGARGFEQGEVATVCKKSDLTGFGVFDSCDSVDGSLAGAIEAAAEFLGNFGEVHGHKDSSLVLGASLAQPREGSTARWNYSLKRRGWRAAAAAAGLRRAIPTTPSTVSSVSAERGIKMRSVVEFRSGGVIWMPLSSMVRRSLGTTPSMVSPSL